MSLARLLERLETTDVTTLDAGGVSAGLGDIARLKGFLAGVEADFARRANTLAASGSGLPADELLGRSQSMSRREAQRASRRADTLGELPAMSRQLGAGRIGAEHADALASAASKLDDGDRALLFALDGELATRAASSRPEEFRRHIERVVDQLAADRGLERAERQRRAATLAKGINRDTGMYWLRAELDPEAGVRVFTALDAELAALVATDNAANATGPTPTAEPIAPAEPRCSSWSITPRSSTICTSTPCASTATALHCRLPPFAASLATPRSTPWFSVATAWYSTWAAHVGWRHPTNDEPCVRCTGRAASATARCRSIAARSTISTAGTRSVARPTSTD